MVTSDIISGTQVHKKTFKQRAIEEKYGVPTEWLLDTLHNTIGLPARNGVDKKLNISSATVADWMDRFGINRRTISEDNHRRYKRMSAEQIKQQTKKANDHVRKYGMPSKIGSVGWSKGLTKHTHPSLMTVSEKQSGKNNPMYEKYGELSPQWKDGERYYRLKEYKLIKEKVKERDNFTCTKCGCTEDEWKCCHKGQPLQVHHIEPYKISKNNSMSNLTTLCGACHAREDYKYRIQSRENNLNKASKTIHSV